MVVSNQNISMKGPMMYSGSSSPSRLSHSSATGLVGSPVTHSSRSFYDSRINNNDSPPPALFDAKHVCGSYEKYARQKQPTDDVEQFIKFVRDQQNGTLDVTDIQLKKKQPLPGIGQSGKLNPVQIPLISGNLCKSGSSGSINEDALEDSDTERELKLYIKGHRRTTSPPGCDTLDLAISRKLVPSKKKRKVFRTKSEPLRRATADPHLPPLERDVLPDRPSAPPPSITPPTMDDDCVFDDSDDGPEDFIDTE